MIHPLIAHLNLVYLPNQWLFLLTAYELAKTEWQPRTKVLQATGLKYNKSALTHFMLSLEAKGAIEQRKKAGRGITFVEVRVTQQGKKDLLEAFNATKPQRVPA